MFSRRASEKSLISLDSIQIFPPPSPIIQPSEPKILPDIDDEEKKWMKTLFMIVSKNGKAKMIKTNK